MRESSATSGRNRRKLSGLPPAKTTPMVVLLAGWPDDTSSFDEIAPARVELVGPAFTHPYLYRTYDRSTRWSITVYYRT